MYIKTLSVTALNNYVKKIIDSDFILNNINVKGEISNFKMHSSGHLYFSLKDDRSKINCIMFKDYARALNFIPKDGDNVIIKGKLSVYEKEGVYQLYCHEMIQQGIGELYVAFQQLKLKLEREGLFSSAHKRPLPKYPRKVGIITSPTGAAIRDIINVSTRRNSSVELLIYPALVQGENASEDIIKGIETLNKIENVDVIILARGGGSLEELWAFNNEKLAYSVYNSKKPIVTGVGHETDFTIVDFVSDRRASTPSAAAEIVIPSLLELNSRIDNLKENLIFNMNRIIRDKYNRIQILNKSLNIHSPMNYILNQYNYISSLQDKLNYTMNINIAMKKENLNKIYALIEAHNPLKVLSKGYAVIEDLAGNIISEKRVLKESNSVKIIFKDGNINANIQCLDEL
ncbi:exodeoxyribonuclease VII large subunit [Clostridium sp. SYSU_GA19001]|uniref:exodeoxyribonuclease VII large subunit n=1 Tax=Clostridium caldaquaticum TaxID=2940653 RepID=UPI00207734B8|nr:exodeoxyribonuclease VII large subunit [Clostridium caldaquaticum]MCM8711047.1 exodeoxyribonuclease VII large subunit [Clostridium caldaquaticum]